MHVLGYVLLLNLKISGGSHQRRSRDHPARGARARGAPCHTRPAQVSRGREACGYDGAVGTHGEESRARGLAYHPRRQGVCMHACMHAKTALRNSPVTRERDLLTCAWLRHVGRNIARMVAADLEKERQLAFLDLQVRGVLLGSSLRCRHCDVGFRVWSLGFRV